MFDVASTRKPGSGRPVFEGPTWLVLAGCYTLWTAALLALPAIGVFAVVPLTIAIALHSSLQHEVLHGHPTRNATLNEALVYVPLGLFIPYRRFRDLHLRHHNDSRLTDPYDDPESFYMAGCDAEESCNLTRTLLSINATFAGRMLIGPAMANYAFWRSDFRAARAGDRRVQSAWKHYALGISVLAIVLYLLGIDLLPYVIAAYAAMSLIMVRSFIEHRAAEEQAERTAVVETNWFWRLLFLNNNYHLLHHDHPSLPWYRLPEKWQSEADRVAERNGGYVLPGYGHVARRWLFRRREPYVHPLQAPQDQASIPR
ncbi:MAG: fatty acid desaturase [Pseudomonadota bacterium]